MQVKCPKCRYKFEEDIPSYVKEASCVCPRCGTPFFYVVPDNSDNKTDNTARQRHHTKTTVPRHTNATIHKSNKLHAVGCLVVAVLALIAIISIALNKVNSRVYNGGSYDEEGAMPNDDELTDTLTDAFDILENEPAEEAPSWIQGKWVAHTEYYDIELHIQGDKITETENDYQASGTFTYKRERLVCDFGKNNYFIYKLDLSAKTIDCGEGIIMHKSE